MAYNRKRVCRFCESGVKLIDYREEKRISRFLTERGKMIPRRVSGTCAKHQRMLCTAIKRARILSLLPFVSDSPV